MDIYVENHNIKFPNTLQKREEAAKNFNKKEFKRMQAMKQEKDEEGYQPPLRLEDESENDSEIQKPKEEKELAERNNQGEEEVHGYSNKTFRGVYLNLFEKEHAKKMKEYWKENGAKLELLDL